MTTESNHKKIRQILKGKERRSGESEKQSPLLDFAHSISKIGRIINKFKKWIVDNFVEKRLISCDFAWKQKEKGKKVLFP